MARKQIGKLQLDAARIQVRHAELALELAKEYEKRKEMLQQDLESARAQLKQAKALVELARAGGLRLKVSEQQVEAARAAMERARAALENATTQLMKTVIRAPVTGYIAQRRVDIGETVAPGVPLMRVVSMEKVYFEAELPERDYKHVREGQPVEVTVDNLPNVVLKGRTSRIVPIAEEATRQFRIRILLPPLRGLVKPGSFARGDLLVREVPNALVIPVTCIVHRRGRPHVFVVDGSQARLRAVELGIQVSEMFEVRKGLREGELVVISGQSRLSDGIPVRIIEKRL
ncbi:MAG TPA: efflux RND transporter periplasmic adaptor subunit [Armatimonadetes bacterium]|nr:efflux RND transporter periplasmic adaptor subunit [Armatimonadota bacterium]